MPFQIQVEAAIIRITFTGDANKSELADALIELERLEADLERVPDRLTDLTGLKDRDWSFSTVFPVTEDRRKRVFPNKFRSAIVAPTPAAYGYARMFQTLNDNPQIDIQVFKTKDEAEKWLASEP
jgi:hypothetical protein